MRQKPWFLLGFTLFVVINSSPLTNKLTDTTPVDSDKRIDCYPELAPTQPKCTARGCIWDEKKYASTPNVPACYYPANTGYKVASPANTIQWKKTADSPSNFYSTDIDQLEVRSFEMGSALRVTIGVANRYTPDVEISRDAEISSDEKLSFNIRSSTIDSFTVERVDGTKIWDTSIGGLLFGDQFIQISTFIPTKNIYGFGEQIHQTLKHDLTGYKTWPMFARDEVPDSKVENFHNLYGVHNFYVGVEANGKTHGVFLLNTNPQEVVTGPGPHLTYRTIGGQLELFFLPGPTPEEVIRQYQQIIGRPYLPAYWAFGYQISHYGFKDLNDLKSTVDRITKAEIPLDVVYADIDYMERYKDFTTGKDRWADFGNYVTELHGKNIKTTLIFDPAIAVTYDSFTRGQQNDASFISWPRADLVQRENQNKYDNVKDTTIMLGVVWPDDHVAFPDFYDDTLKTEQWWINEFKGYHDKVPFDGAWIDMNEPSVFGTNDPNPWYFGNPDHPNITSLKCPVTGRDSKLDNPPYKTWASYSRNGKDLCDATLCMFALANRGKQTIYDVKSLYGLKETISTNKALKQATGKRGQIISRSTFPTSGKHGGHWLGDNSANWEDLKTAIIGAQEFNLFGIPHVGADVCGFINNTNEELCLRWHQLGAFQSFYRNHNDINSIPQDPAQWDSVKAVAREANLFRYSYLPHLYSLHMKASNLGGTVTRPVFFNFPDDPRTYDLSYQFMWGPDIMIIPVIQKDITKVSGYLPPTVDWYPLYGSLRGQKVKEGTTQFEAPKNTSAPVFVRGGTILPRQVPKMTTTETHAQNFQLLIVCGKPSDQSTLLASGSLYWDDGDSLIEPTVAGGKEDWSLSRYWFVFTFSSNAEKSTLNLQMIDKPTTLLTLPSIEQIEIFGYNQSAVFKSIFVNGKESASTDLSILYDKTRSVLRIENPKGLIQLNEHLNQWELTWSHATDQNQPGNNKNGAGLKGVLSVLVMASLWLTKTIL